MRKIISTIFQSWKEKRIPAVINREIDLSSYTSTKLRKIIVITGFRRVGKTYLLLGLINKLLENKNKKQVVYINLEDERIPLKTEFLTLLLPTIRSFSKKVEFLFLDEIQNIPSWSRWLRRIYDNEDIRIFVTGSSSKMSSREIPTELRGRFLEIRVFPLSLKEFLNFKHIDINFKAVDYSENEKPKLIRSLNEYLKYGALPEVVLSGKDKKFDLIQNYYTTVLSRDIIERFKVKNEEAMKALIRLLLNSISYSITKLYNTLKSLNYEIGKTTLQHYLSYVESSYFISSIPIFSYKIKEQMQYHKKVYFIDNGFINALSTKFSKDFGRLYENIVAVQLIKKYDKENVFYWKNPKHEEVDFVIKQGLKIEQLIQVCYDIKDIKTKEREIRALIKASKELKCKNLFIITEDYEAEEKASWFGTKRKVRFIPLWKWLLQC